MEFKDYYATLGVAKTASEAEIKRAYRKLARQHHPDLNPGDKKAEARFKEINEANEVIGNAETRRKYDELGANWRAYEQAPGAAASANPEWADAFRSHGGAGARHRTMTPEEMEAAFGGADPFSDFFQTFFSGRAAEAQPRRGRGTRAGRGAHGQDVEQPVELTLEEAFAGTTRRVKASHNGQEKSFEVRIPAGVADGVRIRAAGEGGAASRGGKAGDLYLTVRLRPHAQFERRGQDLYVRIDVPVTTAVLGGEMSVPTLSGAPLRLKVPALTPHGRTFRLRGHGMPSVGRPDVRGDLYATLQLQIPSELSDEARRHYEALKAMEAGHG
jgi:curved DNA-binding protein